MTTTVADAFHMQGASADGGDSWPIVEGHRIQTACISGKGWSNEDDLMAPLPRHQGHRENACIGVERPGLGPS